MQVLAAPHVKNATLLQVQHKVEFPENSTIHRLNQVQFQVNSGSVKEQLQCRIGPIVNQIREDLFASGSEGLLHSVFATPPPHFSVPQSLILEENMCTLPGKMASAQVGCKLCMSAAVWFILILLDPHFRRMKLA